MIVYISIGNSDDKLSQREWAEYHAETGHVIRLSAFQVHGEWVSGPTSEWQNACWCVETLDGEAIVNGNPFLRVDNLRQRLIQVAERFRQDSIAWAEAPVTEMLGANS